MLVKKLKLHSRVIRGAAGAIVLGAAGSIIAAALLDFDAGSAFAVIGSAAIKFMTFGIPVWVLLAAVPLIVFVKPLLRKKPPHLTYTRMRHGIFELQWDYTYSKETKEYEVAKIESICQCGCEIARLNSEFFEYSYCPNCKTKALVFKEYDAVKKLIRLNVRNKTYNYDYSNIKDELP